MYGSKYVLKSCDYITLDLKDASGYKEDTIADNDKLQTLSWHIPKGYYGSVITRPEITTVEVTIGSARVNTSVNSAKIEYLNNAMNHYATRGYPVIAYSNQRASSSHVILGSGEFVVGDRPDFINLRISKLHEDEDTSIVKSQLLGMCITLKYAYYDAKDSA